MKVFYQSIFFRKISTLLALMIIIVLAIIVGIVIINEAQKLASFQKPLPLYISPSSLGE